MAPVLDRLVLFSSPHMLHRVLPCHRPRTCLSMWFSSASSPPPPPPLPTRLAHTPLHELLRRHEMRKHLAKAFYAEQWAQSIVDSHPDTDARTAAIQTHWKVSGPCMDSICTAELLRRSRMRFSAKYPL